jgi:hypothetical protein
VLVFKKYKNISRGLLISFLILISFSFFHSLHAQINVGLEDIGQNIELSQDDPRDMAVRVINAVMIFLGLLAVSLILWGGFVWMTSNGDENKLDQAKKILKNGVIGLIIILASWGITIFVLTKLIDITGGGGGGNGGNSCIDGQIISCRCGGSMTCNDGSWGLCLNGDCGGGPGPTYCDGNAILPGCQAEDQICSEDKFCNSSSCMCVPKGNLGDSCNLDVTEETCEADNDRCAQYLSCHPETCTCYGPPVITRISPIGGFCENNVNQTCQSDDDCATTCNTTVANGAVDNLITISGVNFGSYDPLNSKIVFSGNVNGIEPSILNQNCIDSWTNTQIIVAVPLGTNSGSIQVVTADEQVDATNDDNGPLLPDFVVNNIVRPGLCLLSPETGLLSDQVNYQGLNLYSAEAYFGNYERNVRGLDSVFLNPAGLEGITTVPNLTQGKTSSFVIASIGGNREKSNYVNFNKESEPDAGPFISYFEPVIGRAGQYVTIYGSGFGGARGFSKVYFGDVEANYEFPPICAESIWNNRQIIVKVPAELNDGAYQISIKLTETEINSQNASPNVFIADANQSLKTSICRISPSRGQIGSQVSIWGEYFGDVGGSASAVFTPNRSVIESILLNQGAQRLNPLVPLNSASGPVKVVKGGEWGNVVNFEIGSCVNNSECGGETCCPAGTYKQNQCVPSLAECYINIPNSVFEWSFATGFGGVTTTTPYDSCQGMAALLGACQVNAFCPNSPGLCSPYQGGVKNVGGCDASCNSVPACTASSGGCTYDSQRDVCILNTSTCSVASMLEYELNGVKFSALKTCKSFSEYNNQSHWEIKIPTSCPVGWTRLLNSCVYSTSSTESSCSLCSNGFKCATPINDISAAEQGVCVSANLCPTGASCSGSTCLAVESARCDCCCEIGQDARDCCAPLVCTGTCGADKTNDNLGLGQCSGCAILLPGGGFDTVASDQACNCSNHSGKYCDTSVRTGVCTDCSGLSRDACLTHSQVCCLNSKGTSNVNDDVCVGGSGQTISNDPSNSDFGYCAYYNCQDESGDPSLCASDSPQKIGLFRDIDFCGAACAANPGQTFCSQYNGDLGACTAAAGCCFNYSDQKCVGGESISVVDGYCAYYDCQAAPNETQCNSNPVWVGDYNNFNSCVTGCAQLPPSGAGKDCRKISTTNNFSCNTGFCSSPFACLNESGEAGLPGDCGACCCQVSNPESCAGLGNGNLVCQPNQTPCSGEGRGLCCGCSQDLDCGDAVNLGCDSGTCCRARPEVVTSELMPAHGANDICRNATMSIPFDQLMDVNSVMNNLILLEEREYGNGVCPTGTFIASNGEKKVASFNWFSRVVRRVGLVIKSIFRPNSLSYSALADTLPTDDMLYCSVPGYISVRHNGNGSIAEFKPKKLLAPATKYYLVVKGDEMLDSNSGVLSQWQVGMNGRGYLDLQDDLLDQYVEGENISFNNLSFVNSYISGFTTLSDQGSTSGLCTIDYVKTEPASYLFQSTNNDPNENDADPLDNTFDTKTDKDKVFSAGAYSADDQLLGPSQGYYWDWDWSIIKPSVASLANINGLAPSQAFVSAGIGVTDDSTIMKTVINMDRFSAPLCDDSANCNCIEPNCLNNCCNAYEDGNGANVVTPLFVFICNNPWPAVNPNSLAWSPWYDTCEGATGNCANYNYKFYYCRDSGGEGIEDDLPAMINPAVILGSSDSLICSEGQAACSTLGAPCGPDRNKDGTGDGFCIRSVLKESYFFKEAIPSVGAITSVIDQLDGQRVKIEWHGNSSLIYNPNPSQIGKYRIYYAPQSTNNWSFLDVKPTDLQSSSGTAQVCSPSAPGADQNYVCQKIISGLNRNTSYVFKVSAISVNQVESAFSNERTVLVTDSTVPTRPQNFSALIVNNQRFRFTWQANNDDTLFYRLYHGIAAGKYGQSFDSNNNATGLELDLREFSAGTHYFALSAVDASGNESIKSIPISLVSATELPPLD